MIPLGNSTVNNIIVLNADLGTDSLGRIGDGNDMAVTITASIPEPQSIALLSFGAFLILSRRRRRV